MSTNYIDQITDTAGTTHDISEGDSTRIFRATCATAAATAAKVATLQTSSRNFSLATGVRVAVTFTYGNSAATPTLNVNSSGAKTIAVATSATAKATGNGTTYNTWGPYETVLFTYDGTYWVNGGSSLSIYNSYDYNNLSNKPTIPSSYGIATYNTSGLVKPWKSYTASSAGPTAATASTAVSVNAITNTASRYYAVEMDKDGRMFVNVPWTNVNSSYITSDSDEKLKIGAVANNTTNTTYYPILATNSTTAATRYYDSTGIHYNNVNGSTSAVGKADLVLGNSTASGSANNKMGTISLYSSTSNYGYFTTADLTAQRTYTFPNATGTVALTSDVTDEKLTIEQVLDSTSTTYTYYPILARKATTNGIRQIDETGFRLNNRNGSADAAGYEELIIGNSTAEGTAGNKRAWISMYGRGDKYSRIYVSTLTANQEVALPDKSGTIALTSDVPDVSSLKIWYGECETAGGTAAKTVSITGFPTLTSGMLVAIKFTNSNSVASPTLSINSGTAHSIIRYGTSAPSTSVASSWAAGTVVLMIYDGTYWRICSYRDNTTYSEISVANITNLTGSSAGLVTGRRFKSAFDTNTENGAVATTNYDKANIKNIIESDSAPGSTTAPNGTVWLQYGTTWIDDAADYVVEHGTSGIWTYRKWNSGIAECWGRTAAATYSHTSSSGSSYYTTSNVSLPSGLFTTVTCGFAERAQGTGSSPSNTLITINVNNLTTTTLGFFVQSASTGSQSITVSCRVIGTWK